MDTKHGNLFHYRTLSDKERKNLVILELIRKKGHISRTEISHITDINIVSISNYVKNFIDKGLVLDLGPDVSSGGRRPELVELNTKGCYVIGLDLGPLNITAAVTDISINVLARESVLSSRNPETLAHKTIEVLEEVIRKSGVEKSKIKAIGIGARSLNGEIAPVINAIHEKFGIETYMGSDAACAAFGEKRLNTKADVEDLLYMYSDVGCGIVIKGDVYFGAGGSAGDMQISREHISREEEAIFFKGAQYLNPWGQDLGITYMAKHEIEKGVGTKIVACAKGDARNISTEVVVEAAKQNDDLAVDIIRNAGMNLGIRVAYLVNLFNPEVVIVGGGIEKAGELILEPVRTTVKKLAFKEQANIVQVIASALGENAVALGAASLVIRETFLKA